MDEIGGFCFKRFNLDGHTKRVKFYFEGSFLFVFDRKKWAAEFKRGRTFYTR